MDLDFVLKWVTGRNLALLASLGALCWTAENFQEHPRRLYERWRYPPQRGGGARAAAIDAELEKKESLRLRVLHRDVSRDIARAAAKGLRVDGLQRLADAALSLDMPDYRAAARKKLNEVRMSIPRGEAPRAVSPDDEIVDIPPDVRGRARKRR